MHNEADKLGYSSEKDQWIQIYSIRNTIDHEYAIYLDDTFYRSIIGLSIVANSEISSL